MLFFEFSSVFATIENYHDERRGFSKKNKYFATYSILYYYCVCSFMSENVVWVVARMNAAKDAELESFVGMVEGEGCVRAHVCMSGNRIVDRPVGAFRCTHLLASHTVAAARHGASTAVVLLLVRRIYFPPCCNIRSDPTYCFGAQSLDFHSHTFVTAFFPVARPRAARPTAPPSAGTRARPRRDPRCATLTHRVSPSCDHPDNDGFRHVSTALYHLREPRPKWRRENKIMYDRMPYIFCRTRFACIIALGRCCCF